MNSKNIILLFIIWLITSCTITKHDKSSVPIVEDKIQFHSKLTITTSKQLTNIECEDFVLNALNNFSIALITKEYRFLKCTKEAVVNIHDPSVIDTIYTFSNSQNKIQIYRSKQKDIIFTFDVTDSRFVLKGNVKTGITEDLFFRKFQITKAVNNKVQIGNSDGTVKFIFSFTNNRLKSIKSDFYLD